MPKRHRKQRLFVWWQKRMVKAGWRKAALFSNRHHANDNPELSRDKGDTGSVVGGGWMR
jgi:hypothetical protein